MPIYLDVSAAVHQRAGLGRYAESLTRALVAAEPERYSLFYNREQGITPLWGLSHVPTRTVASPYKVWRLRVWAAHLAGAGFDRLLPDAELFHATEHLLLPLRDVPTVLTVHDLIFRRYPQHHKPLNRWYLNLSLPLYCRRADHIIAISENTRQDLVAAYNVDPAKVTVVHEAADSRFRPASPSHVAHVGARYELPPCFLIFVGTIEPRKNLSRLLDAFAVVRSQGLVDALVVVGKWGWLYRPFAEKLERMGLRDAVIFPGYVPDDDLPALYTAATACVFPSLYEGFGLPVLEAMACGTPVVSSNSSSIPEVGGDAALYFDPTDTEAMTEALRRILADPELRADLRKRGLAQAACFSWARAAAETKAVYECVLGSPSAR